jgi:hypothetical protein
VTGSWEMMSQWRQCDHVRSLAAALRRCRLVVGSWLHVSTPILGGSYYLIGLWVAPSHRLWLWVIWHSWQIFRPAGTGALMHLVRECFLALSVLYRQALPCCP